MYREYLSCKRENGTRGSPHYIFFYTFLSISILIFVRVISTFSIIFIFKKLFKTDIAVSSRYLHVYVHCVVSRIRSAQIVAVRFSCVVRAVNEFLSREKKNEV